MNNSITFDMVENALKTSAFKVNITNETANSYGSIKIIYGENDEFTVTMLFDNNMLVDCIIE